MEINHTFFKIIFGTAHYKTRFLNFIKTNPKVSKKVIYFVDNDEIYNEFKSDYTIISLDSLRKNHEWSHNYEFFYKEPNDVEYVRNFWDFYFEKNTLLPLSAFRLIFLYMYEKNILKFKYLPNNSFITDNELLVDNYFKSVHPGAITSQLHNWGMEENRYIPKKYNNQISGIITENLKKEFPHLVMPENEYLLEITFTTFSFLNREHIKLFYEIMDSIMKTIFENKISHFFPMNNLAYVAMDEIMGYMLRIFEINFDYKINHWLKYWDNNLMGNHKTTWHDNWYYKYPKNLNEELIHYTWGNFGDFIIPVNPTIETYIERNKELINTYFNHHLGGCKWEITPNNQVTIKFIDK
jgi:hypothetical protein